MAKLASYQYGKDLVRVLRVVRDPKDASRHQVAEYTVRCLLTGTQLETSYTQGDNTLVVPTDTVKNTINVLAKSLDASEIVLVPELFALHIGHHFLNKYAHIEGVELDILQHRWSRIDLGPDHGGEHKHSFVRDGESLRVAKTVLSKKAGAGEFSVDVLQGGVQNLLVLKSTGSAFYGFHRDELTTLRAVDDRIFSTSVECIYDIALPAPLSSFVKASKFSAPLGSTESSPASTAEFKAPLDFNQIHARSLFHTMHLFATDASASVQATLFKMAQATLADDACKSVVGVEYTLPNKHYVPIDLGFAGLDNLTEDTAEVFLPQANPSGLIKARIVRE
ncbi:hypothetical protein OC846_001515 [Tilletia horrida]|uniref:Uricase n=1 Tax=Tilletia horrida TaxID=155126 RepID=A0AAN6GTU5_9BASI|nr:hypothetical protein OC845_001475 [Tilletia horrida]KAK0555963.1 hypothetical protein OC846_001515 [Tilletia horrida]KAK0568851.1 hypothetical protein OC861_001544 [Tilletia horrida]